MMKRLLFLLTGVILVIFACTKNYINPPSPGRMIKQFKLEAGQYGDETISTQNGTYTIEVLVAKGTDLTTLTPQITISDDATISPKSGEMVDISTNNTITYTVTAADGQTRNWSVKFKVVESAIGEYGAYTFVNAANNQFLGVSGDMLFNEKYLNNAKLQVSGAAGIGGLGKFQKWHIIYNSTDNGTKYYHIRNLLSGKLLNVPSGASTSNLQLEQNKKTSDKADDQLWKIEETSKSGIYQIVNKGNGMALTSENVLSTNGVNKAVQQVVDASSPAQKWKLTPIMAESYRDDDVVNFFSRTTGSVAFDQGNSIPLSDGRVLWVTQDAWYQGSLAPNGNLYGNHFISYTNSIIIQPSKTDWSPSAPMMTADGRSSGGVGNLIPKYPGKTWSWPSAGVEIDNVVYIQNTEGDGLGSDNDHQSLFKLTPVTATHWKTERTAPAGLTASEKMIRFANGMIKADDGYVYVFGSRTEPNSFGYNSFLHTARFPQNDTQNWTFWDGSTWAPVASIAPTAPVNTGKATNHVGYLNGKYIHLTMDQGFYCDIPSINMYISTSSSPTGPFTPRKLVYSFTEFYKGSNARVYTPIIHTEAVNGKDELLVTYSMNFGACVNSGDGAIKESDGTYDPYYYRVKGVRIPYSMIGL